MSVYRSKKSPYYLFDFEWRGQRFHGSTKKTNRLDAETAEKQERERVKLEVAPAKPLPSSTPQVAAAGRSQKEFGQPPARSDNIPSSTLRTPKYAAARLACSLQTLVEYVQAGTLKYVQVGNGKKRPRRMYTDADLDEFVAQQTRRKTPVHGVLGSPRRRRIGNVRSD